MIGHRIWQTVNENVLKYLLIGFFELSCYNSSDRSFSISNYFGEGVNNSFQ